MSAGTSGVLNDGYAYVSRPQRGGQSVLDYLCATFTHSSREVWAARLAAGEVRLDSVVVGGSEVLRAGQVVVWQRPPWPEEVVPLDFMVLYQDADLLAVSKPSGLPTMPGGGFLNHTLLSRVRRQWPSASPLHRLGRGTSGLVLFSLNAAAGSALLRDWREEKIQKIYRTLAAGHAPHAEYDIQTPIGPVPHARLGEVFAASPAGKAAQAKAARSLARVLERRGLERGEQSEPATLFEVQIFSGRPHQIRIHLASVGLPLLGDPLYLPGGLPRPDALPGDLGYWLHAHTLEFAHPRTGQRLSLSAPLPPELEIGKLKQF